LLAIVLAVTALAAGAVRSAAQVIEVPAFPVGSVPPIDWTQPLEAFDVAAGGDGGFAVGWMEVRNKGNSYDFAILTAPFTASGTPLQPPLRSVAAEILKPRLSVAGHLSGYTIAVPVEVPSLEAELHGHFYGLDGTLLSSHKIIDAPIGSDIAAAGLPSGTAFAWQDEGMVPTPLKVTVWDSFGRPRGAISEVGLFTVRFDIAGTRDGGFVVAFDGAGSPQLRFFNDYAYPLGPVIQTGVSGYVARVAASPAGDVIALLMHRYPMSGQQELYLQRFDGSGTPLGAATLVDGPAAQIYGDLAFDLNGNLYVAWNLRREKIMGRGYDTSGVPIGDAVQLATSTSISFGVGTARLASGDFVTVWRAGRQHYGSIVSLCTPGTSVCGDGVTAPLCERCDDGAANSDTTPDACRTDCRPPHCGDGVTDSGEQCDDANATACDGCTDCRIDVGLGCGDGIAIPACGETCDDNNMTAGDGCANDCTLERAPGGGPPKTDCFTEWSIENSANVPLYDKNGDTNRKQVCTDNDADCDFDGGVPGSCTFHVRVCANNTERPACTPGTRLSTWDLRAPSAARAAGDQVAAAQRDALLATVPGSILGPTDRDLCSPFAAVVVPLRPNGKKGKLSLKTDATAYTSTHDVDKLSFTCLP
jgi:cysteine-rich repeat protein